MTTVIANPGEFRGYSVSLLQSVAHLGKAILDDDALYEAAQAYAATAVPGGIGSLGPALLTEDASVVVKSITAHTLPAPEPKVAPVSDEQAATWDSYELADLIAKAKTAGVVLPKVKTPGKVIAALEAAGVTP